MGIPDLPKRVSGSGPKVFPKSPNCSKPMGKLRVQALRLSLPKILRRFGGIDGEVCHAAPCKLGFRGLGV